MSNQLYLDIELLEADLRKAIKSQIKKSSVRQEFGDIHLVPIESDFNQDTKFPAIWITVAKNGPYAPAQEDIEVEPFSRFSVTVETYTSGKNKRSANMRLAKFVTYLLQTRQKLDTYYNRGLKLDQEIELSSFVEDVNRRVLRFSGVVDNASKLILNKEI